LDLAIGEDQLDRPTVKTLETPPAPRLRDELGALPGYGCESFGRGRRNVGCGRL